ncbi:MAG: hypothetical protein KTR26_02115 [Flammeovirgaceae bacterium]|nr:hypothetical protein [Flammeovirgaceae bacterium]
MKKPKIKSNLLDHLDFQKEGKKSNEQENIKNYLETVKVFKVKKVEEEKNEEDNK